MGLNDNSEFKQLLADVENNMDSIEKCSELFEHFLSNVPTHPSIISERLELAILLLCVGRYQESYNIIRKIERTSASVPAHTETPSGSGSGKEQGSYEEFLLGKSAPPSSPQSEEASEDEDVLEDVDWLLPQPNKPARSPYQWLYIGQIIR